MWLFNFYSLFSILIHGLMLVLNLLCVEHILLCHAGWLQIDQLFTFLFFQTKRVNHCEGCVSFEDIEHQFYQNIFHQFRHYTFL